MASNEESIATLPNGSYGSFEEAYNVFKNHGIENGYGFLLHRSRPHHSTVRTYFHYRCDKSRIYKSKALIRETSTRTNGCPFNVVVSQASDQSQWRLEVKNASHTHLPSLNPLAHNVFRKRTQAQAETIRSMTQAGNAPKKILTELRQKDPHMLVTANDVRNDRVALRARFLAGRTPIEALLDDLSVSSEWQFDVKKDTENRIQYLFFAHSKQIKLQLANPDVVLMDSTYKTNKYRLPLLHILGCTSLHTFFSAGFCFLRYESHQAYHWAISAFLTKTRTPLPRVFLSDQEQALKSAARELMHNVPQLLCIWHVNKNVLKRVQETWCEVVSATEEQKQEIAQKRDQFMARWNEVRKTL
jgi:transposase-like protein